MIFNYDANKTHFHNKGFALSLVLKVRFIGTRKWPIQNFRKLGVSRSKVHRGWNYAGDWLNLLPSFVPNLGAIGSNAGFCESFSGLGLERPILSGAEDEEFLRPQRKKIKSASFIQQF